MDWGILKLQTPVLMLKGKKALIKSAQILSLISAYIALQIV